ncbi:MAG TPA: hypothetical protein VK888_05185, partial [Anaerolineales bacterium]|nr:hypothetical protein [Anaerolineales bacterium]
MATYAAAPRSHRSNKIVVRSIQYFILLIVVVIMFVPIVILIFGSLKTTGQMYSQPYTLPSPPHWENLWGVLSTPTFWTMLRNSILVMFG